MISVILYGRNDTYGYNLHKRGAISLNSMAEVLSHADDEILFVDYNTPNELPTFIEAISDTLTERAKKRLRVLRVRPELHKKIGGATHLEALEPHSRNIAIRRSNPRNRWILLTNTDMIFLPRDGFADLTSAAEGLTDGLYTIPRFELPEPLWEQFPRSDPRAVLEACRDAGEELHLDEVTLSIAENRYDQVGDFQLVPRQALWDIHGFDERMIHGWHCDSNIARRLHLYYGGRTESLAERLKGYHCDHTRVATGAHRMDGKVDNNVYEFVFHVDEPAASHQAETWGAPKETIEELDFANDPQARYVAAVERVLGAAQEAEYESDAAGVRNFLPVNAGHVLPYVASDLSMYRQDARFAYAGNHARMLGLIARAIAEMGFEAPLEYVPELLRDGDAPPEARPVAAGETPADMAGALQNYRLVIFDLSLDPKGVEGKRVERVTDWPRLLRYSLGAVARLLAEWAGEAGTGGRRVPDVLVINANHHTFRDFVNQFLLLTFTPFATHVRKGRPRVGEERRSRSNNWKNTENAMVSFFGYDVEDDSPAAVALDASIDFTSAGRPGRFKDGDWGATDYSGSWTDGRCAAVIFEPPADLAREVVAQVRINEAFLGLENDAIRVEVRLDGTPVARWNLFTRYEPVDGKAVLGRALLVGKSRCRLEFLVENPQSPARMAAAKGQQVIGDDPRLLGFKVQHIDFLRGACFRYKIGETLEFTGAGKGGAHGYNGWALPDDLGTWTLGGASELRLIPDEPMEGRAQAIFSINDAAVNEEHPTQTVRVLLDGSEIARWTLGPVRDAGERRVLLPPGALATREPAAITFEMATPRTPMELGWSTWDIRPLGFRLAKLRIASAGRLKYRLGDTIDFVESGDSLVFVGDRMDREWSLPGFRGSWTIGERASFHVALEEPAERDLDCAFVISDCMVAAGKPKLGVTVMADGKAIAEWALENRRPHRQFATIPALEGRAEVTITFEISDPRSPESLGWSADARPLGFQLARVAIGRREVEMPKFQGVGRERPMYRRILGLPQYALHVARILIRRYRRDINE